MLISDVTYRVASGADEWIKALEFVNSEYKKAKLASEKSKIRLTPYHLTPFSNVFIAENPDKAIISSASVIEDAGFGLPLEAAYTTEVSKKRLQGKRLIEIFCLASIKEPRVSGLDLFIGMCRIVTVYALQRNQDELVIAVHPAHARLYKRLFNFKEFGPVRYYSSVQNAPAVALYLELSHLDALRPEYQKFLNDGKELYKGKLGRKLSAQDCEILASLLEEKGVFDA